jgi:hypothetical protein
LDKFARICDKREHAIVEKHDGKDQQPKATIEVANIGDTLEFRTTTT